MKSCKDDAYHGLISMRRLYLDGNSLSTIESGVFDQLTKLELLDLSDNQLRIFKWRWISSLDRIQTLKLNNNKIRSWDMKRGPPPATHGTEGGTDLMLVVDILPMLKVIEIKENLLKTLDTRLLERTPELEHLDISQNLIESIPPNAFEKLSKLRVLILRENRLTILHVTWFSSLVENAQTVIDIEKNPWHCDCEALEYEEYLQRLVEDGIDQDLLESMKVECSSPPSLEGKYLGGDGIREFEHQCSRKAEKRVQEEREYAHSSPTETPTQPVYVIYPQDLAVAAVTVFFICISLLLMFRVWRRAKSTVTYERNGLVLNYHGGGNTVKIETHTSHNSQNVFFDCYESMSDRNESAERRNTKPKSVNTLHQSNTKKKPGIHCNAVDNTASDVVHQISTANPNQDGTTSKKLNNINNIDRDMVNTGEGTESKNHSKNTEMLSNQNAAEPDGWVYPGRRAHNTACAGMHRTLRAI